MSTDPAPQFLGGYRLIEPLGEGPVTRSWLAEQASVGRTAVVEELRADAPGSREQFVADIRAKASVGHPLIGSVYEAVATDSHCFFARESLSGPTLADRVAAHATLRPADLALVLRKVAEAQLHLEGRGLAAAPLELADIHLDERRVVRVGNIVTAGQRQPDTSASDLARLGEQLPQILADGHRGTTRMLTLLGWMTGRDPAVPQLDWRKVHEYATRIEQQLAEPLSRIAPPTAQAAVTRYFGRRPKPWLAIAAVALIAAVIGWVAMRPGKTPAHGLPAVVHVPAGDYPAPDGGTQQLREFWISGHEVTIDEYARFLAALDLLAPEQRRTYDHEDQPPDKPGHQPDDWQAILDAATNNNPWKGLQLARDCPVVNVDWWDAYAYCDWQRGRLPAQEEWFAALSLGDRKAAPPTPAPWGSAASHPADRTATGIHDMAGSVAEWTHRPAANPAMPMVAKKPVIVGASYLRPDNGARAREWIDDRSLRRPDLGFRVAFDYAPE